MSSLHCVVVWEWQCEGAWLPHGPGVARTLERAHSKRLTRVVLADAEPALLGHTVNLRTLTQSSEGESAERAVRRACYSVHSPGGRGARWEAGRPWRALPMGWQCALEEAWAAGEAAVALPAGWAAALCGPGRGPGRMQLQSPGRPPQPLRRVPQPPYPLARAPHAPPPPPHRHTHNDGSVSASAECRSIPAQPASSSTLAAPPGCAARSPSPPSPRGRPSLAHQLLTNLRLRPRHPSTEPLVRRHSVDTVSTYLSHESKDSIGQQSGSVGELLDVSSGSDDVFGGDGDGDGDGDGEACVSGNGRGQGRECLALSPAPQGGCAVCPLCQAALGPPAAGLPARLAPAPAPCAVCSARYGPPPPAAGLPARLARGAGPAPAPCAVCSARYGPPPPGPGLPPQQPPGSMTWTVQPASLATHPGVPTIIVTYNFQSGRQRAGDPVPGAPYYAVGFPRRCVLPRSAAGRRVLAALARAWAARRLFALATSHTTGRDTVVVWGAPPPPQTRDHYARLATQERAEAVLRAALCRLTALLGPEPTAGIASGTGSGTNATSV